MGSDRFHTGRLDPPTADYAERDTYKPNMGSLASQAEYTSELEEDALLAKRGFLARDVDRRAPLRLGLAIANPANPQ